MNLAGRRLKQDFETKRMPGLQERADRACPGTSVPYEIDWDSFDTDNLAIERLWIVVDHPLIALEGVCKDDLGREAVAASLKKIVLHNAPPETPVGASFADGTLDVTMHPADGVAGSPGFEAIEDVLANSL